MLDERTLGYRMRAKSLLLFDAVRKMSDDRAAIDLLAKLQSSVDDPLKRGIVLALGWHLRKELGWTRRRARVCDGTRKASVVYDAPT